MDAMRIVTCPACSSSFQIAKTIPKTPAKQKPDVGVGSDFSDFFEIENTAHPDAVPQKPPKVMAKPPEKAREDDFAASAADFLKDALDQNPPVQPPPATKPSKTEGVISDEVFGGLEGFEEFLGVGDDSLPKPKASEQPAKPAPPVPPKKEQPEQKKAVKDSVDDAFEELFGETKKPEPSPKARPFIETKPPAPTEKIEKKPAPSVPPPPKKPITAAPSKSKQPVDTVSDEAFEALFHDIKPQGEKVVGEVSEQEGSSEPGLGIDFPKTKKRFNFKLALYIAVPVLVVSLLSHRLIFTKKGLFGLSFYSYFVEGYRKPNAAVMKGLNEKFDQVKGKLKTDNYKDYISSIVDLKDILSKDSRYIPAHAYLVYSLLLSSSDPLNQSVKKDIDSYLAESEKLSPALNEGILARAFYSSKTGDPAGAEKIVSRLLASGLKDPLAFEIVGNIQFSKGNYSEAKKNYNEALTLEPENLRVKHSLSMAVYNDGKVDEALTILDAIRKPPSNHLASAIDWNYIEWINFNKKDQSKINFFEIFEKSADQLSDFNYARLAGYIGDMLYKDGNYKDALPVLEKGSKREPFNSAIAYRVGLITLMQGNAEGAIPYLKKAVSNSPKEISYAVSYAKALREHKETELSLSEIGKALQIEPTNIDALMQKGLSEKELGKSSDALATFDKVLKRDPRNAQALVESGDICVRQENYKEAREFYIQAALTNNNIARVHSGLGMALVGLGQRDKALFEFEKAEKLSPDNIDIILNIGKSFLAINKLDDASKSFERVVKLDKNNIEALSGLGDIRFAKQEYSGASSVYKDALRLAPKEIDLKVKLAKTYIELKQFKPALDELIEANKIVIDYFPVYLQLGIVYRNLGNIEDSLRELEKSTALRPDSADAHYEYGATLILNAQVSNGLPHLFKAVELDPKHVRAYEKLVDFYFDSNDIPKAIDYSLKILEVDPKMIKSRLKLAECYRKNSNDNYAYKTYMQVINQNKYEMAAYLGAGQILEEQKQYPQALKFYSAANRLNPKDSMVVYHLGFVYKYLNDKEKALESFRKFLRLAPDAPEVDDVKDEIDYLEKR